MANRNAFQAAARRTLLGKEHELSTLEGYKFKPRKYSVRGAEAIQQATQSLAQSLPASIIKKASKLFDESDKDKKLMVKKLADELDPEELQELIDKMADKGVIPFELQRLILQHGIGEHNFTDDPDMKRVTDKVDTELVDSILEYPVQAAEMIEVIQEHNGPLESKTSGISEMSPNGSTDKTTLETTAQKTKTEEAPQS